MPLPRRLTALASLLLLAAPCHAIDLFEIQVYDDSLNAPRTLSAELHANSSLRERTRRMTLEPAFGLGHGWELGGYLQSAIDARGVSRYAGAKFRAKKIFLQGPRFCGLNFEVSDVPPEFEDQRWGGEIRPIAGLRAYGWTLAANPILSWALTRAAPEIEPSFKASYAALKSVGLGVEYYSGLGPLHRIAPSRGQEHVLYGVFDLHDSPIEANLGFGWGLTPASDPWMLKAILGMSF